MHVRHIKYYMKSYYDGGPLIIISVRESTFLEIYIFKRCPEGRICGKFLKKKSKMYFIEGRFWSKVAVNFVSVLLAYNAPSICPRQNASATASTAPGRAKQDKHRYLYSSSTSNEHTEDWEGSTLSMTHTNIRDDVQQAGDPSVNSCCALRPWPRIQRLLQAVCGEPLAAGRVGRTPRGGSTQRATPRGLDCGYRVPHLAR